MRQNFVIFAKKSLSNLVEAIVNLFLFLPYFFSVLALLKTLFSPWKNLVAKKTSRGFTFQDWSNRFFFNLISRTIGFFMRISILLFYVLVQIAYVLCLPFIILFFIIYLPFSFLIYLFEKTEVEKKNILKNIFINNHLLKQENLASVEQWFEKHYREHIHQTKWWNLKNLFSMPPLARDWALGYTPTLDEFIEELTCGKYQSRIKNIVDRKKEIEAMEQVLSKNETANVLIVGEEEVGKHTVVDALSKKIYEGQTNSLLAYKRLLKLNLEKILTVHTDQKQREEFLEELFFEASEAKNVILMIENLDKYVFSGENRVNLSTPIEKYGRTSNLQFVATTTPFFYQKCIFTNEKINRLFTKVDVKEIEKEEAKNIVLEAVPLFQERSRVIIPYETVINTVEKSEFYITNIPFPEKAINLLDEACIYYRSTHKPDKKTDQLIVLPEIVDIVLSEKTHIPTRLTEEMKTKLLSLERLLSEQVIQQTEAINQLASSLRRAFILLGKRKKPLACFLFLGPTGVGKTETAKALSQIFFGSEKYLVRFDMSLYQTKQEIPHLVGSIDTGHPGLLTKAVRENPYSVLLLDEIEKADKDLINIFLTMFDEGYFTDGTGHRVDCKNTVIIATSNAASNILSNQQSTINNQQLINYLISNNYFTPEFLNRFDGIILFQPIKDLAVIQLAKMVIERIKTNIYNLYKVKLEVSDLTLNELIKKGYNPSFGARDLERVVTQEIENKVSTMILENKVKEGEIISL